MILKDALKVLVMLTLAVGVVAALCYARVDLGMTQEQVNQQLEQWIGKTSMVAMLIWSQLIVAAIAGVGYKIWRHHHETKASSL